MTAIVQFQEFLDLCLSSDDELFHSAVYDWMMNKKLYGELVSFGRPTLEYFLQRSHNSQQFSGPEVKEILWMFLERQGNHATAANILFNLAKETRYLCQMLNKEWKMFVSNFFPHCPN